ncbi:MAG: hypothetical protein JW904_11530 [Spirochaetales bacterium]|nr:hypothetical protein [Spirochaetales bacterium]
MNIQKLFLATFTVCVLFLFSVCDTPQTVPSPGIWGAELLLETDDTGSVDPPQIVYDNNGKFIASWSQHDGTRDNGWICYYSPSTGWELPLLLETDDNGAAGTAVIAFNGSGRGFAVWPQSDGINYNVMCRQYIPETGWGAPLNIENYDDDSADSAKVAVDVAGNAFVVWLQKNGGRATIWSNHYNITTGWDGPVQISNAGLYIAGSAGIACDKTGNAIATWLQVDSAQGDIWTCRYDSSTGWDAPEIIESNIPMSSGTPSIVSDGDDNMIVIWTQSNGTFSNCWTRRYIAGTGWTTAVKIDNNSGEAWRPVIAMNESGNAFAVWSQYDGIDYNIWANTFSPGSGWGTAQLIEFSDDGGAAFPDIACNNRGDAVAVWSYEDEPYLNIYANQYIKESGWGDAFLIESSDLGNAGLAKVACDSNKNAVAVWRQYDGSRADIWANSLK